MKKIFAFVVENIFSRYAGTCLKFILQNIFLKSLRFEAVIFDLPQTDITQNEKIRIFSGLKRKNFVDGVENMFLYKIYIVHLIICTLS